MGLVCVALGRGRIGKTFLARFVLERALRAGRLTIRADGDRNNASLSRFSGLGPCMRPHKTDDDAIRVWLGGAVAYASDQRLAVYADLGGGDRTATANAPELLERAGLELGGLEDWGLGDLDAFTGKVELVLLYHLGADFDDPAGLALVNNSRLSEVPLVLVLNEGIVRRHGAADPFASNLDHPEVKIALERGARILRLPALAPDVAAFIEASGLGFGEAATGAPGVGGVVLGLAQRQALLIWMRAMEAALAPFKELLP